MTQTAADPTALLAVTAVVVVLARQLVGIATLGTFAPALLALAALLSPVGDWPALAAVLVAGLVATPVLRLAQLPRVARIGVTVAVLAAVSLALTGPLGVGDGGALPLVATVAVVERLVEVVERDGVEDALVTLVGTLVVAVAAYAATLLPVVVETAQTSPMVLAVACGAAVALVGSYRGRRLSELWRFRHVDEVELHEVTDDLRARDTGATAPQGVAA